MHVSENRDVAIFLVLWTAVVAALFLHTSGHVELSLLRVPQAKGNLWMLQEGYKQYNLVGLRDKVYAIKQGVPFIHPRRTKLLKRHGIFTAHSKEEAQRMVDARTEEIQPRLTLREENFKGYNLYALGNLIYAVPAIDPKSGHPQPTGPAYSEQFVGMNLDEAKRSVSQRAGSGR